MSDGLRSGQIVVVMDPTDDVATALRDLEAGEAVAVVLDGRPSEVVTRQPIPFGHKFALRAIPDGGEIRKYGAVIGRATAAILPGEHVHVHNLSGVRGRGDLAARHRAP